MAAPFDMKPNTPPQGQALPGLQMPEVPQSAFDAPELAYPQPEGETPEIPQGEQGTEEIDLNSLFPEPQVDQQAQAQAYYQQQYGQALAAAQAAQEQNDRLEATLVWNHIAQNYPEEQHRAQWETYTGWKQQQYEQAAKDYALAQYQQYVAQMEQAITPLIRSQVIAQMSQKSKVPKELLERARSPQELRTIIETYTAATKRNNLQTRKAQGNDRVGDTSGQSSSSVQGEVAKVWAKYEGTGKTADFLSALRKAQAGQPWQ